MNKILSLFPVLLLVGCPGSGDRMMEKLPANVKVTENNVCITYPVSQGDRITSIQIGSNGEDRLYEVFSDKAFYPETGRCLPTFNYKFEIGSNYTIFYSVSNNSYTQKKLIQANFIFR
ncbi:putative T6SS immunity periplasmic lipoprotein [Dickeya fangzhongdai]|uniref:putative T6SS immunity periplasmic lipoprotein n=1 Tax=Dickeya fangzhongdai TaxID=1778540 RepID=UPI0026DEDF79|nr:putative T6SS immunity periplasmic lipoprotein [Dickeya fangzhongdai]WKV52153.1 hypothetical protein PL145_08045 [Dickeya fangzhongdai]